MIRRSLAARFALAAMTVAAGAVAVVAAGVLEVGSSLFDQLMREHGATAAVSHAMFDESIRLVVVIASAIAIAGSIALALALGAALQRPLDELARAARAIAAGRYESRVRRPGTTELASVADSFNQMAAALEDQERERSDLIQNFAHELRTPLTNLHGYLEGLADGVVEPSPAVFGSLRDEVERLQRLSRSLDALADGSAARPESLDVDLVRVINALIELNRPQLDRRSVRWEVQAPGELMVRADGDSLAQVLGNLLQNAARYTNPGGTVWIKAEQQRESVLVSVANTGEVIPPGDLDHVFERFYRVEKSRGTAQGGAGIGLAIVKQVVERLGGAVGAESQAGITRFWFRLPA